MVAIARRSAATSTPSPLRRARLARMWTLERLVEEMDQRAPGGHCGVTATMVSGWELGRHTTSIGHRKTLCEIYGASVDDLFAHQDRHLGAVDGDAPQLLARYVELHEAMMAVVAEAQECLIVTGSRTRSVAYLQAIEEALVARPSLIHYRVLYGPPRYPLLQEHLLRLLDLRDPHDRTFGVKTLHLAVEVDPRVPERFFLASERAAVVPIPSLTSHSAFDSGVLLGGAAAPRLLDHGRQAYAAGQRIESVAEVEALGVVREG
ncbi:helix-turn-helix transcriptional regulator [Micromonospora sp. WMMD1082]|uniref:helix-turn-helix transcriptional regulator n=1 Tax=Micromonospora sp. WMMD1082 TaxID=3016104 RepID=UPI0024167B68|nr:helix-turn-helix transcriptional regulator [Micromonospora sp. WMMD1082]MDG4795144.1 helix-turn-helix transcriptional regulator [Micromonospora sp. WMMD1082]